MLRSLTASLALLAVFLAAGSTGLVSGEAGTGSTLARDADPVVLTGADVPALVDVDPGDIVAFKYGGGWQQIPVQVDERDIVGFGQVYNGGHGGGVVEEQYTDPNTYAGPDSEPLLDANDEVVFMAKDAGGKTATAAPAGVLQGSGVEVRIDDPLDGGVGYVYLFVQAGGLDPGAGQQYVTYTFDLLSGDYKTTYLFKGGPGGSHGPQVNAEDSLVATPFYERHWSYRWTNDDLRILLGTGVDILEKRDYWIGEGVCGRHNATFNADEGAFFVNKSGPVRAIRSYMGANSGPLTQRDHIYYEAREDEIVFARVHARNATGIFYNDYNLDAIGMTYANNNNPAGLTIDGVPDPGYVAGPVTWEMIAGPQGSMVVTHEVTTDIPDYFDGLTSYYHDELNAPVNACQECEEAPTGACPSVVAISDAHLIGAHGPYGTSAIPSTDPRDEEFFHLSARSVHYYDGPGLTSTDAEELSSLAVTPLETTVNRFKDDAADTDGDTVPNGADDDDDGDGCTDMQEAGLNPALGGQRDAHNFWDFRDVPTGSDLLRDNAVIIADIWQIVARFGATGDPGASPYTPPPPAPDYHPAYDTGGAQGLYAWSLLPPDGAIVISDIFAVVAQFGHSCT